MDPVRLLIVDDHYVVRRGLRRYMELMPGFEIAGEAASGPEALALAPRLRPDVIMLDLAMPGMDGISAAAILRQLLPRTPIILFTSACGHAELVAALRAGVSGVLLKDASVDELALAIRTVLAGQPYLQPSVAGQLISGALAPAGPTDRLTERERQIYGLVSRGLSNKEIAAELRISEKTTSVHVSNLMGKLGLRSRTQVALYALQRGAAG